MTACGYSSRYCSSQLRASRSRWFVGSSRSSSVGRPSSSFASAMRICQPPENVSVCFGKEAFEYLRHAKIDAVALLTLEELRQVVVTDEQCLVLTVRQRRVGERMLDAIDFRACVEERLKGRGHLVLKRSTRVTE